MRGGENLTADFPSKSLRIKVICTLTDEEEIWTFVTNKGSGGPATTLAKRREKTKKKKKRENKDRKKKQKARWWVKPRRQLGGRNSSFRVVLALPLRRPRARPRNCIYSPYKIYTIVCVYTYTYKHLIIFRVFIPALNAPFFPAPNPSTPRPARVKKKFVEKLQLYNISSSRENPGGVDVYIYTYPAPGFILYTQAT